MREVLRSIECLNMELIILGVLVITQCSIRHLYELTTIPQPEKENYINLAKRMERRRCNHHTLEKPLSTLECLANVIDPKQSSTNKNRYVVASQEDEVRRYCRGIKGVPLIYVKRSVMVMEPMADSSVSVKAGIDRGKFRVGLRRQAGEKRKREDAPSHPGDGLEDRSATAGDHGDGEGERSAKKKRIRGPKGPNPLSMKKPKKRVENPEKTSVTDVAELSTNIEQTAEQQTTGIVQRPLDQEENSISARRKRKRKHKPPLLSQFEEQSPDFIADN